MGRGRPVVFSYERWSARTDKPLLGLALLFLVVLAAPILDPTLPDFVELVLAIANIAIWALFAFDYAVRLWLVEDRRRYVRTHLPDLAAALFPALRPLRLLRLFSIGHMLAQRARGGLAGEAAKLVTATSALVIFIGGVAILDVERDAPDANITAPADGFWWALTTMTTVGYGDRFPVTTTGRLIAAALMLVGIALLGVLTASIAAWFIREVGQRDEANLEPVEDRLARLELKIDHLLAMQSSAASVGLSSVPQQAHTSAESTPVV
jgi:voltage-gated potassium channel